MNILTIFFSQVQRQRNNKSRVNSGRRLFQVPCYLKWINWRAQGCCSEQKYLPLDNTVDECFQKLVPVLLLWKCKHKVRKMAPEEFDNVLSNRPHTWIFVGRLRRNSRESMERRKDCLTLSSYQWIQRSPKWKRSKGRLQPKQYKCMQVKLKIKRLQSNSQPSINANKLHFFLFITTRPNTPGQPWARANPDFQSAGFSGFPLSFPSHLKYRIVAFYNSFVLKVYFKYA